MRLATELSFKLAVPAKMVGLEVIRIRRKFPHGRRSRSALLGPLTSRYATHEMIGSTGGQPVTLSIVLTWSPGRQVQHRRSRCE
jgi:hypothetical protein